MNINLFIKAVCLSVLSFLLAYGCYQFSKEVFEVQHSEFWETVAIKTNYKTFEEKASFENVEEVVIEAVDTDIEFDTAKGKEGRIALTTGMDSHPGFQVEKENHRLTIKLASLTPFNNSLLTLKLPASVKKLEVKNVTGDIRLNQLELSEVVVSNSHGDIRLNGGEVRQAQLQTVNGDIRSTASVRKLQVKSVFGDLVVDVLVKAPQYRLETVSGDITLTTGKAVNAKLELRSVNGTVTAAHGPVQDQSSENQGYISAKTVNGDVNLKND